MGKNFNEIKNQLSEEIKQKQLELEDEKEKFIQASGLFCSNWIIDYAKEEATHRKPEITETLGARLKDFKTEVESLSRKAPELIKKEFTKKEYWGHYGTSKQLSNSQGSNYFDLDYYKYKFSGNRQPKILDIGIRLVIGRLGAILEKYAYLSPEKSRFNEWEKEGTPYYQFGLDWSQELKEVSEIYAEKLKEFEELNCKLDEIIKEERQSKARQSWDSS